MIYVLSLFFIKYLGELGIEIHQLSIFTNDFVL